MPLTGKRWGYLPLGEVVRRLFELNEFVPNQQPNDSWSLAVQNWYLFNWAILDNDLRADLERVLSNAQVHSYRVLLEWWTAECQDSAVMRKILSDLMSDCNGNTMGFSQLTSSNEVDTSQLESKVLPLLALMRPPVSTSLNFNIDDSRYNTRLRDLFEDEFKFHYRTTPYILSTLQFERKQAVVVATCQRTSNNLYKQLFGTDRDPDELRKTVP